MNSLYKIISRMVLMTALLALLLLVLNVVLPFPGYRSIHRAIHPIPHHFRRAHTARWAILLDAGRHKQTAGKFQLGHAARCTGTNHLELAVTKRFAAHLQLKRRGRLFPLVSGRLSVTVWTRQDGLLVLGNEQGSYWKYLMIAPTQSMEQMPTYFRGFALLNAMVAILLALLSGFWLYSKLKPLSVGITALSVRQPVHLPEKGLTGDLNRKLNNASTMLLHQQKKLQQGMKPVPIGFPACRTIFARRYPL